MVVAFLGNQTSHHIIFAEKLKYIYITKMKISLLFTLKNTYSSSSEKYTASQLFSEAGQPFFNL